MNFTCQSEYLPLASVYIKTAPSAFIDQGKLGKEWERLNYLSRPDFLKAKKEYVMFESLLKNEVKDLRYFHKNENLSIDSIYCRDASIATDHGAIICNMGKEARNQEPKAQERAFLETGMTILGTINAPGTLEGGDVAWLDRKTLAVGLTYRTNAEGIRQLKRLLVPFDISVMVVDLPHYKGVSDVFHLMSIFSPIDKDLAVVYSPLMPIRFRNELMYRGFELVEVVDSEFESMGCNVLALSPRKCLMVKGNPETASRLVKAGCEVLSYTGNEISVKGGGGPTCLTRPIQRIL